MNLIKQQLRDIQKSLDNEDHYKALCVCKNLEDDLEHILGPHWDIQGEDEQYEDPEMWDYGPIYDGLQRTIELLHSIDIWYMEDEGYDDSDKESIDEAKQCISSIITDIED